MTLQHDSAPLAIDGTATARPPMPPSERSFGLLMAAVSGTISLWPLLGGGGPRRWAVVLAVVFAAAALLRPALLRPLNRAWMRLGLLLHRIVAPVVFGLLYFVVLTPLALALRLAGRRVMPMRPDPAAASYWIARPASAPFAETMRRQF